MSIKSSDIGAAALLSLAVSWTGCNHFKLHQPAALTSDPLPPLTSKPGSRQSVETFAGIRYLLYLPDGYAKEQKRWPLILYLHGKSLRGNDLEMLKRYGLAALLEKDLSIPFIVVSPQCPSDRMWTDQDGELCSLLDHVSANYAVEQQQVYLTGHSMGGRGSWQLAYKHPERFAAIVPMSDAPLDDAWAKRLSGVPAWVFHGTRDDLEPFERTQRFVKALQRLGADVKLTPLPGRDHYILDTYENKEIYNWLLQHKSK